MRKFINRSVAAAVIVAGTLSGTQAVAETGTEIKRPTLQLAETGTEIKRPTLQLAETGTEIKRPTLQIVA